MLLVPRAMIDDPERVGEPLMVAGGSLEALFASKASRTRSYPRSSVDRLTLE